MYRGITVIGMDNGISEPNNDFGWDSLCWFLTNVFGKDMNQSLSIEIISCYLASSLEQIASKV